MTMTTTLATKEPSKQLKQRIKTFVRTTVKNAMDEYDSIIKDAVLEGFTEHDAYKMVYNELKEAGYSRQTIWRMLPDTGRGKPRGKRNSSNGNDTEKQPILYQNVTKSAVVELTEGSQPIQETIEESQPSVITETKDETIEIQSDNETVLQSSDTDSFEESNATWQVTDINDFVMRDIQHYSTAYIQDTLTKITEFLTDRLGYVVRWSVPITENKKEKQTPVQIEERNQKVLSLVKEGTTKIKDIVKQTEVSDSSARRVLKSAGYTITKGVVSLNGQ